MFSPDDDAPVESLLDQDKPKYRAFQLPQVTTTSDPFSSVGGEWSSELKQEPTRSVMAAGPADNVPHTFGHMSGASYGQPSFGDFEFDEFAAQKLGGMTLDQKKLSGELSGDSLVGASSNSSSQVPASAEMLPPKPLYTEKYTSFSSSGTAVPLLLEKLKEHLDADQRVDFECDDERCKIQALVRGHGRRAKFNVRFFRGDDNETFVEFQRRWGDVVAFTTCYREARNTLGMAGMVHGFKRMSLTGPLKSPALHGLEELGLSSQPATIDPATVNSLYGMATCDMLDVQREGLCALASCTTAEHNQRALVESEDGRAELINLLKSRLVSVDDEVCHTASVLLANVCRQQEIRQQVAKSLTESITTLLNAPTSLSTRDTKRQVASALSLVAKTQAKELMEMADQLQAFEVALDTYSRDNDTAVRESISETRKAIQALRA